MFRPPAVGNLIHHKVCASDLHFLSEAGGCFLRTLSPFSSITLPSGMGVLWMTLILSSLTRSVMRVLLCPVAHCHSMMARSFRFHSLGTPSFVKTSRARLCTSAFLQTRSTC